LPVAETGRLKLVPFFLLLPELRPGIAVKREPIRALQGGARGGAVAVNHYSARKFQKADSLASASLLHVFAVLLALLFWP
jgi:hypothetical protein